MFSKFQKKPYLSKLPENKAGLVWIVSASKDIDGHKSDRHHFTFKTKTEARKFALGLKDDPDLIWWEVWIDWAKKWDKKSNLNPGHIWVDPKNLLQN